MCIESQITVVKIFNINVLNQTDPYGPMGPPRSGHDRKIVSQSGVDLRIRVEGRGGLAIWRTGHGYTGHMPGGSFSIGAF